MKNLSKLLILLTVSGLLTACGIRKEQKPVIVEPLSGQTECSARIFTELNGKVSAGLLFDQKGFLYVSIDQELIKVAPDGNVTPFCSFKDMPNTHDYYFRSPLIWDMVFDQNGDILAAAQDRILRITPDGNVSTVLQGKFDGFLGVSGIATDRKGNIYITNGGQIERYTPDLQKSTFVDGSKDGYNSFFSIAFDPNRRYLYVSDFFTKSLLKYRIGITGRVSKSPVAVIRNPLNRLGAYGALLNVAFSEDGTMYASIDGTGKILKVDTDGTSRILSIDLRGVANHLIAFGSSEFNKDCLYITTMNGRQLIECDIIENNLEQ